MQQQKNRNKKKMMRRNSLTGGAPLEPIYENERVSRPMLVMSGTIPNHGHRDNNESSESLGDIWLSTVQAEAPFQIITDMSSQRPSSTKSLNVLGEGRWGNGDNNISCDSNSSINTASTSSLTASIFDAEDDCVDDFFEELNSPTGNKMTQAEIMKRATDVISGKYDYNNDSNSFQHRSVGRRRQARRSSMPTMPIRQESIQKIDPTSESPPSTASPSSPSQIRTNVVVAVDKFGIPIRPVAPIPRGGRRRQRERRSSMPSREGSKSTSSNVVTTPKESPSQYGYSATSSSAKVDKFGIPIPSSTGTMRRRREGRRSSVGDYPSVPVEEQGSGLLDRYGVPIITPSHQQQQPLGSSSIQSSRVRRSRHGRRSSMPIQSSSDADTVIPSSGPKVDKFGIPIPSARPLESSSTHSRRRQGRRSSMPTQGVSRSVCFALPPPPPSSSLSIEEEKKDDSSLYKSRSVPVDKFGIPMWPKEMRSNGNNKGRRRKQERRSSMPTTPTAETRDKCGASGSNSNKQENRSIRRGRRPSMPTVSTQNNHNNASALRFFSESGDRNKSHQRHELSVIAPANGAPIRPKRVPSTDNFGSQKGNKNVAYHVAQPNARFDVPQKKTANQPPNAFSEISDDILGPSSQWGVDARAGTKSKVCVPGMDASVNDMQQKDGEWWW